MSGSANKGRLRWCYSLVESSMNDVARTFGHLVLPPLLAETRAWNTCTEPESEVLTHCWVLRHQVPCEQQSLELSRPPVPPTAVWSGRAGTHLELLIVDASIFATFRPSRSWVSRFFQSLLHESCVRDDWSFLAE